MCLTEWYTRGWFNLASHAAPPPTFQSIHHWWRWNHPCVISMRWCTSTRTGHLRPFKPFTIDDNATIRMPSPCHQCTDARTSVLEMQPTDRAIPAARTQKEHENHKNRMDNFTEHTKILNGHSDKFTGNQQTTKHIIINLQSTVISNCKQRFFYLHWYKRDLIQMHWSVSAETWSHTQLQHRCTQWLPNKNPKKTQHQLTTCTTSWIL